MTSVKKRLLASLLTVIVLSTLISTIVTYFELKEEMDELFDENMKQIVHAISVHDITTQSSFISDTKDVRRTLKGEEEFLIQIWHKDLINFSSKPAITFPKQDTGGVRTVKYKDIDWRYFGLDAGNDWLIQVSQPIPMRHTVIWEIYFEQLIPTLIQLPVLMGIIWLVVGFGFSPLSRISRSIETRTETFLEKLSEKDTPQEVLTMVQAINGLLDRLSRALNTQKRFTADAAHELRTPLTAVRLELDVLKRAETQQEKDQSLQKLYKAVDRCTRLVEQLLEIARLEPERVNEKITDVSLPDIIKNVTEESRQAAKQKNISLEIERSESITIKGQAHALTVLASNLVNNALQYTPDGGKIRLSIYKEKETKEAIISISDNGPGIPEAEQTRIFDRFYRITGKKHIGQGSGLGLSIVKSIADHHKASINLHEGLDKKGVSFEIRFPLSLP